MSARGPGLWLAIGASVLVAAALVLALMAIGSPARQRDVRMDDVRADHLEALEEAIQAKASEDGGKLPAGLDVLAKKPGQDLDFEDPVDGTPYEYAVLGPDRFKLCAHFATDTGVRGRARSVPPEWQHGVGRTCFERRWKK